LYARRHPRHVYRSAARAREAEIGVPVRRLALGRVGGDLVQVDVERDAIETGRADRLFLGDAGLLGELAKRRGEQPWVGGVEVPTGQESAVQRVVADHMPGYGQPGGDLGVIGEA
jgi:hypothetical protein